MTEEADPKKYYDKNGKEIPADAFENEPSAEPLNMTDEELEESDARIEALINNPTPKE